MLDTTTGGLYCTNVQQMRLTKRQQQILDFIRFRREANGQPPSLREIAKHFHFRSVTAAADHVAALVKKGLVKHQPGLARSLQVVSPLDWRHGRVGSNGGEARAVETEPIEIVLDTDHET